MRAVVARYACSHVSGGGFLFAHAVRTLLESGYEVAIASMYSFDKEKYKEWYGIDLSNARVYSFLPRAPPLFYIYQRLGFFIPLRKAIKKEKPDVVFIDNELYRPILGLKRDMGFGLLEYIHFPWCVMRLSMEELSEKLGDANALEEYSPNIEQFRKKYERGFWRYYFEVWRKLHEKIARENPFEAADVVMANSRYTGRLVKALWGGNPLILYPPVRTKDFAPRNEKPFDERDNAVVMLSRVSPEKRIEDVIDAVALTETKPVLRVVGGFTPAARNYRAALEKRAREKGVKVEFYSNIPRSQLVRVVTSSKVFVHAAFGEHFGIAVVEGMAAGCPAIVHRSGGPYEDILDYGRYGLTYQSVEELAENIDKLMQPDVWHHYHKLSLEGASRFSEGEFAKGLLEVIEKLG